MEPSEPRSDSSSEGAPSGQPPEQPSQAQPLVEPKKKGGLRALDAVLIAIVIVLAAALAIVVVNPFRPSGPAGPVTIQSASPTGIQGKPVSFTLQNVPAGATVHAYMGDGNVESPTGTSFYHIYDRPGTYLVWVKIIGADGTVLSDTASSLVKVIVVANPSLLFLQFHQVAVPTIYFNTTQNPQAPIGTLGTAMYLYGGFTEISQLWSSSFTNISWNRTGHVNYTTTQSVSVDHYVWQFGNGQMTSVAADTSTFEPATNPTPVTYSSAGLYTANISLVTVNTTSTMIFNYRTNQTIWLNSTTDTYVFTVSATLAIGATKDSFTIPKFRGTVPSPGVLTELVNSPGGPYSFDPQVDYETTGFEVVVNTMGTLLIYNGSSTTSWIPYLAASIPTTSNGGISSDFKTYTFHMRSGLHFSNGDPLTAYDVYYTTIRAMLFQGGAPGTADWIISQYLVPDPYFTAFLPIMTDNKNVSEFNAIHNAVTYDNGTNNVTFHLVKTTPATLFFTSINDALGMGIMDHAWLQSVGAGITFTPKGFYDYQAQGTEGGYNFQAQFQPVASGPFEINTYVPGQSVILTPNPYFTGVPGTPGIAVQNKTVILEWVADPAVAYQLFASNQGDIVTLLPPNYYQQINKTLVPDQATINGPFPSITEYFNVYNNNVSVANLGKIGSGYSIPHDYFANLLVRKAFAYAFDYATFLNRVLGNQIYGFNFGSNYCGTIVKGLPYYVPPAQLTGCPTYDLTQAKAFLQASGEYNVVVTFPYVVPSGDTTDFGMGGIWAAALTSIDPNIHMQPVYQNFASVIGYQVNGSDPMPIFSLGWIADYPYPSDYVDAMYKQGGTYPQSLGWYQAYFNGLAAGTTDPALKAMFLGEGANYTLLNKYISAADAATNPVYAQQNYTAAQNLAVQLYMYVYTYQATAFWIVKPWISPYLQSQYGYGFQTNPTIGAGADSFFAWWNKG